MTVEIPIGAVVIRERSRKEMRNLDSLAESIKEIGLLHPPVVRQENKAYVLVAGQRRVEAMRSLGFDRIPVTVVRNLVSEVSALRAEGEENTCREPFTPSEAVAHADRIEAVMAARAKERMAQAGAAAAPGKPATERGADSSPLSTPKGKTRDQVAEAVGLSHPTLTKARSVVDAAKNPELPAAVREIAEHAAEQMDATGKVEPAFRAVEKAKVEHDPAHQAIKEMLENDDSIALAQWHKNFSAAALSAAALLSFAVAEVAAKADEDEIAGVRRHHKFLGDWLAQVDALRPAGLRLVSGGAQ